MHRKSQYIFLASIIIMIGISFAQEKEYDFPVLKVPCLGQKPRFEIAPEYLSNTKAPFNCRLK